MIRKVILCILLFTISATIGLSEEIQMQSGPIRAASYIGMCSKDFPCTSSLKVFKGLEQQGQVKGIGFLAETFGRRCPCVKKFLRSTPGSKYVRVHIANGTCFPERGRKCVGYDVFKGETIRSAERKITKKDRALRARYVAAIKRTKRMFAPYAQEIASGALTVRYSICLECPFDNNARRVLLNILKKHVPEEYIVDSVLTQSCLSGTICERHGEAPKFRRGESCITDTDGISFFEANLQSFRKRSRNCESEFYWSPGFNMLEYGAKNKFIPPLERKFKPQRFEFQGLRECIAQSF